MDLEGAGCLLGLLGPHLVGFFPPDPPASLESLCTGRPAQAPIGRCFHPLSKALCPRPVLRAEGVAVSGTGLGPGCGAAPRRGRRHGVSSRKAAATPLDGSAGPAGSSSRATTGQRECVQGVTKLNSGFLTGAR